MPDRSVRRAFGASGLHIEYRVLARVILSFIFGRPKAFRRSTGRYEMAKTMIENSAATAPAPVLPSGKLIDVYVVPKNGKWLVRVRGNVRSTHETSQQAIRAAMKIAHQTECNVVVRGEDGRIEERLSGSLADALMLKLWKRIYKRHQRGEI